MDTRAPARAQRTMHNRIRRAPSPLGMARVAGLVALLVSTVALAFGGSASAQTSALTVPVISIDGPITPVVSRQVSTLIEHADPTRNAAVLIEVDAQSGTAVATEDVITTLGRSRVPVLAWVPPGGEAAGPGAVVLLAGDVVALAPDARLDFSGQYSHTANPFDNDRTPGTLAADLDMVAGDHGRALPEIDAKGADEATDATTAVHEGAADLIAPDTASLLRGANGLTVPVDGGEATVSTASSTITSVHQSLPDRLRAFLSQPTVAYLLLCFGIIGLFLELSAPGITFAGLGGLISILIASYLLAGMPLNWTGVAMMLAGLVLLVVDIFVPSLGLLTIGGLSAFVIGSYVLFSGDGTAGYTINPAAIWTVTACLVLFFVFLGGSVLKILRRRPYTGSQALIGRIGETRTALDPVGMVFVDGEMWRAHAMTLHRTAAAPIIPAGTPVRVTGVEGLMLEVRVAAPEEKALFSEPVINRREVVPVRGEIHGSSRSTRSSDHLITSSGRE